VAKVEDLTWEVKGLLAKVDGIVDDGSQEMENAGELIDIVSDFWFIKGKLKKQKKASFPLLANGLGP
jgi:hypothetical protein